MNVAVPLLNVPAPSVVVPSRKVTVPVGVAPPLELGGGVALVALAATVAESVTG